MESTPSIAIPLLQAGILMGIVLWETWSPCGTCRPRTCPECSAVGSSCATDFALGSSRPPAR